LVSHSMIKLSFYKSRKRIFLLVENFANDDQILLTLDLALNQHCLTIPLL
jgi:hypothetical protein